MNRRRESDSEITSGRQIGGVFWAIVIVTSAFATAACLFFLAFWYRYDVDRFLGIATLVVVAIAAAAARAVAVRYGEIQRRLSADQQKLQDRLAREQRCLQADLAEKQRELHDRLAREQKELQSNLADKQEQFQDGIAEAQRELQRSLSESQNALAERLGAIGLTPVITASWIEVPQEALSPESASHVDPEARLELRSVGLGPALDIRVTWLHLHPASDDDDEDEWYEVVEVDNRDHLGAGDSAPVKAMPDTAAGFARRHIDAWIIHYADLLGRQYHTYCNVAEEPRTGKFHFSSEAQTLPAVRYWCDRCQVLLEQYTPLYSSPDEDRDVKPRLAALRVVQDRGSILVRVRNTRRHEEYEVRCHLAGIKQEFTQMLEKVRSSDAVVSYSFILVLGYDDHKPISLVVRDGDVAVSNDWPPAGDVVGPYPVAELERLVLGLEGARYQSIPPPS